VRYFFRVEYDGSQYGGWQRQPNALSIQEQIEKAFTIALRVPVEVTGAGRTDAGVHARAQGAHVDVPEPLQVARCELSVNALLPPDISIYNLVAVEDSFHARFSALSRRYKYYFCSRKSPLHFKRVWMLYYHIDWNKIEQNLGALTGKHDFSAFCASGCGTDNMICDVKHASLQFENEFIVFTIEADRFIYKMVRTIVGTLIDIGRGKSSASLSDIIRGEDRAKAGATAPPFGLVLDNVFYSGVN